MKVCARSVILILLTMGLALAGTPRATAQAPSAYQAALADHLKVQKPFLKEYQGKVKSWGYEFGKYVAQYFGAPASYVDALDYAKAVASEGDIAPGALARYLLKRSAATFSTSAGKHLFDRLNDPQRAELAEKLAAFGFSKGADVTEFQRKVAGVVAGVGRDDEQSSVAMDVIIQTTMRFNLKFAIAYSGYRLAAEGFKEMDRWVSNKTTLAMFDDLERWDPDAAHPENRDVALILEQRTFDAAELAEPRRILAKLHAQDGKAPPTDLEVKHFILQQYNEWAIEKEQRASSAPLLQRAEAYFNTLSDFDKRKMLGGGDDDLDDADLAEAFIEEYMEIYRTLMEWKGDKPWPAGGPKSIEDLAFDLLKRKLDNYADEPWKYDDWFFDQMQIIGWAKKPDEAKIASAASSLAKLMATTPARIDSMAAQMGMVLSDDFKKCVCAGGQWYEGGMCHFTGSLGGEHAVPVDGAQAAACLSKAFPGDSKSFAQRVLEWPERRDKFGLSGAN